jgi:excisionase family DNA binding protein
LTESLLLTPEEAAQALRIGRTRLYEMLRTGELGSVRVGRSRRIARRDIEGYVETLRVGQHADAFPE